jgi:magnesium-transporting ATPase (P-type)
MSTAANPSTASEVAAWHAISADEVLKRLATDAGKGLDAAEATTRLQKYGPNRLPEGKKRGPFMRFLSQFNNVLVYVLLAARFTKLMLNLWIDAAIIFGVVILNGLLGFIQEGKAEKALESIRNMLSAEARTLATRDPPEPDRDQREQRQAFCLTCPEMCSPYSPSC